jgi:hypothetical protein
MAVFRILHASDLHFGATANQVGIPDLFQNPAWLWQGFSGVPAPVSSHNWTRADALAAFAFYKSPSYNAILITGDLATKGNRQDLQAAFDFLFAAPVRGYLGANRRPTLQAAGKPILLLPGNHDRFGHFHRPGNLRFDQFFHAQWPAGQGVHTWPPFVDHQSGEKLIVIGVDFTLSAGDLGNLYLDFLAQGRAYQSRVDTLLAETQKVIHQHQGSAILWAMHFPPRKDIVLHELLEAYRLEAALQTLSRSQQPHPVLALLCGHLHFLDATTQCAGIPVFICGTTTQHMPFPVRLAVKDNSLQVMRVETFAGKRPAVITVYPYRYTSPKGFA